MRRRRSTNFSDGGISMRKFTVLSFELMVGYIDKSFLATHLHSALLPKMEHVR